MTEHFTYIMAGGGAAGLSIAHHILRNPGEPRILIVDPERKNKNDRTWCFWSAESTIVDPIAARQWDAMWFRAEGFERRFALEPYRYTMTRAQDYYRVVIAELQATGRVVFLNGNVDAIEDGESCAQVRVGTQLFTADYVFDSRFVARDYQVDTTRYHFLKQHFIGWTIETQHPVFDPEAFTIFDLRVPQDGAFRFMYILPETPRRALVEYTLFSSRLLEPAEYEQAIEAYIRDFLGGTAYTILERENGVIPMTDQPAPRRGGRRIMYVGTKGGMVKASTGFAFHRIQKDSARIAQSIARTGQPFHGIEPPRRYRTFDAMLLSILDRHADSGREIFVRLFSRNPLPRLWRFLDEEGSLWENIQLMATVPWIPFIIAYLRVKLAMPIVAAWRRRPHGVPAR